MRLKYQDELQRESRNNEKALTYDGAKSTRVKLVNGRTVFDRRTRSLPNGSRNIRKEKLKGSGDPGSVGLELAEAKKDLGCRSANLEKPAGFVSWTMRGKETDKGNSKAWRKKIFVLAY